MDAFSDVDFDIDLTGTSPRQRVYRLLASGQTQAQVAKALRLSKQTVFSMKQRLVRDRWIVEAEPRSYPRFYTRASLLMVDEGRDILDEDLVYSSVEPMLANSNGAMAIFSTPWMASGKLWEAWHSPFYARVRAPSWDSCFVSREYVESQRTLMSHELFQAELAAEFMQTVAAYFSIESISRCLRDYGIVEAADKERTYALGVDFGRHRDASVFVVASRGVDGRLGVDWVRAFVNVPLSDQRPYARYLDGVFGFRWITVEAAGLGYRCRRRSPATCRPGRRSSSRR